MMLVLLWSYLGFAILIITVLWGTAILVRLPVRFGEAVALLFGAGLFWPLTLAAIVWLGWKERHDAEA